MMCICHAVIVLLVLQLFALVFRDTDISGLAPEQVAEQLAALAADPVALAAHISALHRSMRDDSDVMAISIGGGPRSDTVAEVGAPKARPQVKYS